MVETHRQFLQFLFVNVGKNEQEILKLNMKVNKVIFFMGVII